MQIDGSLDVSVGIRAISKAKGHHTGGENEYLSNGSNAWEKFHGEAGRSRVSDKLASIP